MATDVADHERIAFAREVMQLFVKCFTNLKLFPHTHQHCKSALENFSSRIRSFVKLHEVLRFGITQEALTVEGQPVYEEQNRNENLAFRLYVDGLREVSVVRGATGEEAEKLAYIFYQAVSDPKVDTTLLLWEAEFKNVEYVAINSLSEAWAQPDYLSQDALKLLNDMNKNVDAIVQSLTAPSARSAYEFELSDGASELEKAKELDTATEDREEGEDIFQVEDEALNALRREAAAWGPDRLLQALFEAALDGLALAPDIIGRDHVQWLLREAADTALRGKNIDMLAAILTRLEGELQLTEEEEEEALFKGVFVYLGDPNNVGRLIELTQGQAIGGPKSYTKVLGMLGESGVRAAVATLKQTKTKELREALEAFLIANLGRWPQHLHPLLQADVPADQVKSALFLAGKTAKGKAMEEVLNLARKHPDKQIQQQATHLWRTQTEEGRLVSLSEALETAQNKLDRIKAAQQLVQANHRPTIDILKRVIESQAFLGRDAEEKEAMVDSLRRLAGKAAIAFLQQQASRSTFVLNRKAVSEVVAAAQKALDAIKAGK